MTEVIFGIVLLLITIFIICLGIHYIHEIKASTRRTDTQFNKQEYVKDNRQQVGVSNRGSSMDERKIYIIGPSDLGL